MLGLLSEGRSVSLCVWILSGRGGGKWRLVFFFFSPARRLNHNAQIMICENARGLKSVLGMHVHATVYSRTVRRVGINKRKGSTHPHFRSFYPATFLCAQTENPPGWGCLYQSISCIVCSFLLTHTFHLPAVIHSLCQCYYFIRPFWTNFIIISVCRKLDIHSKNTDSYVIGYIVHIFINASKLQQQRPVVLTEKQRFNLTLSLLLLLFCLLLLCHFIFYTCFYCILYNTLLRLFLNVVYK